MDWHDGRQALSGNARRNEPAQLTSMFEPTAPLWGGRSVDPRIKSGGKRRRFGWGTVGDVAPHPKSLRDFDLSTRERSDRQRASALCTSRGSIAACDSAVACSAAIYGR